MAMLAQVNVSASELAKVNKQRKRSICQTFRSWCSLILDMVD